MSVVTDDDLTSTVFLQDENIEREELIPMRTKIN